MKRKNIVSFLFILAFILILGSIFIHTTPALAQTTTGTTGTTGGGGGVLQQVKVLADKLLEVVKALLPVAFGAALLFFFWGLAKFILNPEDRESGKNLMIWGLIALFVIASVWGIVKILQETFGITDISSVTVPGIK